MSALTLLHTADWQIGKPFASTPDPAKRRRLQQERLASIARIADLVRTEHVNLVLVAGDIFDSPSPEKSTVSATFHAIGQIPVPVIAIPGNHDFGGAGGPWEQDFVRQEMTELAPNFHMLTQPKPYLRDELVILPAPLEYRQNHSDPWRVDSLRLPRPFPARRPPTRGARPWQCPRILISRR